MILPRQIEGIRFEIKEKITGAGAELVEIQYRKAGPKSVLTFIVDKDGGITLEDCAVLNHRLGAYFDSISSGIEEADHGPIQGPYTLEVSSPGLDRALVQERDFERATGQTLRVTFRERSGFVKTIVGKLESIKDGVLNFELEGTKGKIAFPLSSIIKAAREILFHK